MAQAKEKESWNNPEKIDSLIGWLIFAAVGGVVFVFMGRNLIPYAQLFGRLTSAPVQGFFLSGILGPLAGIVGNLIGILLFTGIQLLEVRPQLISNRLPKGEARAKKLKAAYIWMLIAFALDVFFCFIFWPPVNSALGWGIFRGGFAWALINKWNIAQTFVTLFGGVILVATWNAIKKHW